MADLYGTPGGEIAWEDMRGRQVTTQETLGRIAAQPAALRKTEAEADRLEQDLNNERRMAAIMQQAAAQGAQSNDVTMADYFDTLAGHAAGAGLLTKAQELAKTAGTLRSQDASAANSAASRAKSLLDIQRAEVNLIGQTLGSATDEASWAQANRLFEFQSGMPSPYSNIPYDPDFVKQLNQNALTAKERLDLEEKRIARLETGAYRRGRLKQFDAQQAVREAELLLRRQREARLAKNGGKTVSTPSKRETEQVVSLIEKDYPGLEAADLEDAAFTIAADAKDRQRTNPALNAAQAMQQAYLAAKQAGDFQQIRPGVLGFGKKETFAGGGKTPQTAMSVPKDQKDLRKGRFYLSPQGLIGKWTGQGFELVDSRVLSEDNERPDEDED